MSRDSEQHRRALDQLEARRAAQSAEAERIGQGADEAVALRELQTLVAHYVAARYELTDVAPVRLSDRSWTARDDREARARFDQAREELLGFIAQFAERSRGGEGPSRL
jgi:hypothetical protein